MTLADKHKAAAFSVLADFLPALAVCGGCSLAVFVEVIWLKTPCADNSLVEWCQFGLIASAGLIMAILAIRRSRGRAVFLLAAGLFFDMAIRELDACFDVWFGHGSWIWPVALVTTVAIAATAVLTRLSRESLLEGVRDVQASRAFPLLPMGLFTILCFSRMIGTKVLWRALGTAPELMWAKRVVEEGVELLGYAMVFLWVLSFVRELARTDAAGLKTT